MKRDYGTGTITKRGDDAWRLRYRVNGERHSETVRGTKAAAVKRLREILNTADRGDHVAPDRQTVGAWIQHWTSIGCPGERKRAAVTARTQERYETVLRVHVTPALGRFPLQKLTAAHVERLYAETERAGTIGGTTLELVHTVLKSCLSAAVRKKLIANNPAKDVEKVPRPDVFDHDIVEADDLPRLVAAFKGTSIYEIVATAAFTGARLREIMGLRWEDVDLAKRILTIRRTTVEVRGEKIGLKEPKTANGRRVFKIDPGLTAILSALQGRHKALHAGVPDGTGVDLSLIKLPDGAVMFPPGADLMKHRRGCHVSDAFKSRLKAKGFPATLRFHDLRGSHAVALMDAGVNVKAVADRIGDDPATLLKYYAKRSRKADDAAADAMEALTGTL